MKDPRRLLDGDGSEEQRALLRAAALEEPTPDGRARLLGALGVTPASVAAPTAPTAPTAQAPSTAPGGLAAGSSAISATKLVVLALGGAAILGAGALLWSRRETPARRDVPSANSASPSALSPGDQAAQAAEPSGSVALEVAAIERVRSELGRKDGRAALAALGRYASEHPAGVLAHEADVLRVEALLQAGDAPAALELAEQLLLRHGDSPHRARLQALARQASAPSAP
jgi:hypothetical protein